MKSKNLFLIGTLIILLICSAFMALLLAQAPSIASADALTPEQLSELYTNDDYIYQNGSLTIRDYPDQLFANNAPLPTSDNKSS